MTHVHRLKTTLLSESKQIAHGNAKNIHVGKKLHYSGSSVTIVFQLSLLQLKMCL